VSRKDRKIRYKNPVTGKVYWLEEDEFVGLNDHSLKGVPKGAMGNDIKAKISDGLKTDHADNPRVHSADTKEQISEALTGKAVSDETRKKLSKRAKEQWARQKKEGHVVSTATKKKLSKAGKGKPKSAEHRAKISAAMKAKR